jgi:hypothetical protein
MEAYSQGEYTAIPSGTYGGTVFTPSYSSTIKSRHHAAKQQQASASSGGTTTTGGSTGGSTGGTTGGSTGGSIGGSTGGATGGVTDPITQATQNLTDTVTTVTQPVVNTLNTLTEALNFCTSQFASIPDPLHLLDNAKAKCAAKVEGMTETDAAALIPNTLTAILSWLGL